MTVYPPAPLLWQQTLALDFTHSQIAYVGYEGTIFHISGPFAPILGAQSGVVIQKIAHLDAPFKHLDNKGARQDGTTWYDTIYDPAEITMVIRIGGMTASDTRKTIAAWNGAWDARQKGQLCWFSPERGEWVANVRLAKPVIDTFEYDWYESQMVTMTWIARNDDAFWQGPDSICQFNVNSYTMSDLFVWPGSPLLGGPAALDSNWNQTNTGPGNVITASGNGAAWNTSGTTTGTAICEWVGHNITITDDQFITVTLGANMPAPVGGVNAYVDIWGRMNQTGTQGNNGVRWRIGYAGWTLSIFNSNGTQHDITTGTFSTPPKAGDTLSLQCGVMQPPPLPGLGAILGGFLQTLINLIFQLFTGATNGAGTWGPNHYQVYRNGSPLIGTTSTQLNFFGLYFGAAFGFVDTNNFCSVGSGFRSAGFGMSAGGTGSAQVVPPSITTFSAGTGTGVINLTNIGDQPAYPRYLCYGPGTFLIQDVGTNNMISFGPLMKGQVVQLNTQPRLPPVVDLTPNQPTPQIPTATQNLITTLVNFATNNNVPPLLQEFESLFGIAPPQGPLASLLTGRFTGSIPGMKEQAGAQTTNIACHIQGGSDQTQIVAALTPYRRWPE